MSGAALERPVFSAMLDRLRRGEFEVVIVWAFDRFSRAERFDQAIGEVLNLEVLGVRFVALRDPEISTPADGTRAARWELLIAMRA